MVLTHDDKQALVVLCVEEDESYEVQQYDLDTGERKSTISIRGEFVKAYEVE